MTVLAPIESARAPEPLQLPFTTAVGRANAVRRRGGELRLPAELAKLAGKGHGELALFVAYLVRLCRRRRFLIGLGDRLGLAVDATGELTFSDLVAALNDGLADEGMRPAAGPWSVAVEGLGSEPDSGPATAVLTAVLGVPGTAGAWEYDPQTLEPAVAKRIERQLATLTTALATDPDRALRTLPLLDREERRQLELWGHGEPLTPSAKTLDQLFAARAARQPAAAAVLWGEQELTYGELDRQADALAARLRALGVERGALVGVAMPRTADLPAVLLAVMRCGAAYVPLDPSYPAKRLAFMLADTAAAVVVSEQRLARELPLDGVALLAVDGEESVDALPESRLADPADLAYVIYTSGSTGRPKGVAITHGNAVALMTWARARFPRSSLDGMLASTSINFDLSVFELFLPLVSGGRIVLADNALALTSLARRDAVRFLNTVPSAMKELLRLRAVPPSVVTVALAGEPLPRELAEEIYALGSVAELYDLYGPSEDTTYSTGALVPRRLERAPLIGRPIAGSQAWVVDRRGELAPIGVPAELLLGGAGLARGYLKRPALTAERFVPDAWGGAAGERLYRTGDLVRFTASGELDFLGRIDNQVKVRGFRIELGEIESELRRQPGVGEAVVLAHGDDPRLVAFVVPGDGPPPAPKELAARLERRLPAYMVPSRFVTLDVLPLTPNGKIDRRALERAPLPDPVDAASGEGFVAPRNAIEEELAARVGALLAVGRVGVEDDLFALGAHSLQVTRLVAETAARYSVDIELTSVFAAPTVAGLAAAVTADEGAVAPLVAGPVRGPVPLSYDQETLWLNTWLDRRSPAYNVPLAVMIEGPLVPAALAAASSAVRARHEALRTVLRTIDDTPMQVIQPAEPVPLPLVDLELLRAEDRSAAVRRHAADEARRLFDLASGPLLRAILLRLGKDRHALLLTMHHTVSDGWSEEIVLRDLGAYYRHAVDASLLPELPELPLQYADFALWQRRFLTAERLAGSIDYWRRHIGDEPWAFGLPTDRPRSRIRSIAGRTLKLALPAALVERLTAHGRDRGASLFMTLLAAFSAVLERHTGEHHVLVGTPVAGRGRPQLSELVGLFVNTLLLRASVAGNPSFSELLARVRRTTVAGLAHQDVPLVLLGKLFASRDRPGGELFHILFNLQQTFRLAGELAPGAQFRGREVPTGTAKVDLSVIVEQGDDELEALFEYSTELYDHSTIHRLAAHYRTLLEGVAADPECRLSELPLLSPTERSQLAEWSLGAPIETPAASLDALVLAQAERTPERVAVVHGAAASTYGELAARARRLAARLRAHGVGCDAWVAVAVGRSPRLVETLLAVLTAGGAYLPLDPEHPRRRLRAILAEAQPAVLVSESRLVASLGEDGRDDLPVVLLGGREVGGAAAQDPAAPPTTGKSAAYLLFTSGSTGRPKGVVVPHRAVVNLFTDLARRLGLDADDGLLAVTTYTFDISVLELFLPLTLGARTILVDRRDAADGRRLAAVATAARATVLQGTPATWRLLLDGEWAGDRRLTAISGGETLLPDLAERLGERVGTLWNLYGPTETTIYSTGGRVRGGDGPITIGRPLANTRVRLCDRRGRAVPLGVPGELWIGGRGLARDYLGRPGRTAQSFRPDPDGAGARLYASGDLARFRPDGRLELLGRIDAQLKVRGFRIEPGEVETALLELPRIRRAVVTAREVAPGDRRLVAYLVAAADHGTAELTPVAELRRHLAARIPDYMVPSLFFELAELPLTASGKVDRSALPEPASSTASRSVPAAPRDQLEEAVAGIFADLLQLPAVGIHDDFFDLGGHSLLLTQLISRLLRTFDVELSFRQLFLGKTTVADIADHLRSAARQAAPPITPPPRDGELPLSFSQLRQWFLVQLDPTSGDYNIPVALELRGDLVTRHLGRAVAAIVERHEVLRTAFIARGGRPRLEIADAVAVPMPLVDTTALPRAVRRTEAVRLAEDDARRPFDLRRPPLLRTALLRLAADRHLLLINIHHIVADGWSLGILFRELAAFYDAFVTGEPAALPPLPMQYTDYAAWHRRWLSGPVLDALLAYWREQLAGAEPAVELPVDRRRPPERGMRGGRVAIRLDAELSAAIRQRSSRDGATVFMLLLAAFEALLMRYSGQRDLSVGTYVANRHRYEIEDLIGFFVNTLVLRTRIGARTSFAALLETVRAVSLGAYDHQDLPFERLLEELEVERHLDRTPLFQVLFALQNFSAAAPESVSLVMEPQVLAASRRANYDLTLWMWWEDDRFVGAFEYRRDLFDPTTIARMAGHLETLLTAVVDAPETALEALPLLTVGERQQLEREWRQPVGAARTTAGDAVPVGEAIAARTRLQPDAVALIHDGAQLSYGELGRRMRRLAARLRHAGVGPEQVVGVSLRRGPCWVMALLAVLEAGGAYLPLVPEDPASRRAALLADADALLLTEAPVGPPPEGFAGPVVELGSASLPEPTTESPGASSLVGSSLAYVIYTSGSTGRPKGVLIDRPALDGFVATAARLYDVRAGDRVLQFASLAFDTSVEEIFPALVVGATLILRNERMLESPSAFLEHGRRWRLTHLDLPTAYWHQLAAHLAAAPTTAGSALPGSLRLVIIGGEQALAERLAEWRAAVGNRPRLLNTYGPTEATVVATACDLATAPAASLSGVAIGTPLAGVSVEIHDRSGRLAPSGVGGELLLGGAGLARGYLGRPGTTAERFVPTVGGERGGRSYRTGDRARRLADGTLEMLGRLDHQVKIRGFRVELGEIEALLSAHPEIAEAVVEAVEVTPGDRRLVAFLIPADLRRPPSEEALRARLRRDLPAYMQPAALIVREDLPRTVSGKVDRRRLAVPEALTERQAPVAAPETPTEEALVAIWEELLAQRPIGIDDDFFELGGHSLLVPQLLARVERAFGLDLPVRVLFEAPRIRELALIVEERLLAEIEALSDEEVERLAGGEGAIW